MSRDWTLKSIGRTEGAGQILQCQDQDVITTGSIFPDANIFVCNVASEGALTLTIDGSKSLKGDELSILATSTAGFTLTFAGDFTGTTVVGASSSTVNRFVSVGGLFIPVTATTT